MLLLHFSTRAYLFPPDKGSCYIFSTQNNCCEFLASYGVILQSDIHPYINKSQFHQPAMKYSFILADTVKEIIYCGH